MGVFVNNRLIGDVGVRCFDSVAGWLERRGDSSKRMLRVLTYQRVAGEDARDDLDPGMISATPFEFCKQMQLLATRYHVIRLEDALAARRDRTELPENAVLVTFDGAYRDFRENAWPVLRHLGLPATLFVPTAYPDEPRRHFWWDRLYRDICWSINGTQVTVPGGPVILRHPRQRLSTLRRLKETIRQMRHDEATRLLDAIHAQCGVADPADNGVLSWDELRQLHAEGVTLAPHTQTHPLLNRLSHKQARAEVSGSWTDLAKRIGPDVPRALAYPSGAVDNRVAALTADAGIEFAFTTRRGVNDLSKTSPLLLNRIDVGRRTTRAVLRAQLRLTCCN